MSQPETLVDPTAFFRSVIYIYIATKMEIRIDQDPRYYCIDDQHSSVLSIDQMTGVST